MYRILLLLLKIIAMRYNSFSTGHTLHDMIGVDGLQQITISTEYILLGQLLKKMDIISSGGEAKFFLAENRVKVNGQVETRRGKKITPQDRVEIEGVGTVRIYRE